MFCRPSTLGLLLLLLVIGQGCGESASRKAFDSGVQAITQKDFGRAVDAFSDVIRLEPNNARAYYNRALAYKATGDYDKALADYTVVIRLDPTIGDVFYNRGLVYAAKDDHDLAIHDFTDAISLNPKEAMIYTSRAASYSVLGDWDMAMKDCDEAIHIDPTSAAAYCSRADAYCSKGDYDKAVADYGMAIEFGAGDPMNYDDFAWLLAVCPNARIRNGQKAVEYAQKACELTGWKRPACIDTLAAAYAETGNFDEAVKWENEYLKSSLPEEELARGRQRLSLYEQKQPYREGKP